jgi:Protein of unknown function/AsmA-like C-terminal region
LIAIAQPRRILFKIAVLILALIVLCVGVGMTWLATAPRSIPQVEGWILDTIIQKSGAKTATMQPPNFYLNLPHRRLEVEISNLDAAFAAGKAEAKIIRIAVPLLSLLKASPSLGGVQIQGVQVTLPQHDAPLTIPSFTINPDETNAKRNHFAIDLSNVVEGASVTGMVDNASDIIDIHATLANVPASLASLMLPDAAGLNAALNGTMTLHLPTDIAKRKVTTDLYADAITFSHPVWFPNPEKPMRIDRLDMKGEWDVATHLITMETLTITKDTMKLNLHGTINDALTKGKLNADILQLPVDKVYSFWPRGMSDEARTWIVKRLEDGRITDGQAVVTLNVKKGVALLDAIKVESVLNVEGIRVVYADNLPQATDAKGVVTITQDSLNLDISGANVLANTTLTKGAITIPSFSDAAIPIIIDLDLKGTAKDVATYILPKYLNKGTALNLKPETITGDVEGKILLKLPLYPERAGLGNSSFDHLTVAINANLDDISQKGVLKKWDAADFTGTVALDNDKVVLDAKGVLQKAPVTLKVTHVYGKAKPISDYAITLTLSDDRLSAFDIPIPDGIIRGVTALKADIHEEDGKSLTKAALDFTDASLRIKEIDWKKPKGQKALMTIMQTSKGDVSTIDSLLFETDGTHVEGSIKLDASGQPISAEFPVLETPTMSLAAKYLAGAHESITVSGDKLSLKPTKEEVAKEAKKPAIASQTPLKNPFKPLFNRTIKVDIAKVETEKAVLKNVTFASECHADYCSSLRGDVQYNGDNRFQANIASGASGKRTLTVRGTNMGTLLEAMDMTNNIQAGAVNFDGTYDDSAATRPLTGRLSVEEVVIKDVPIVTQLLTLVSLRGIADTLTGNGIAFDKIASDVGYENEIVTISNGSVKGDAIGVLLAGTVAPFTTGKLNMKGSVVPSYTFNSLPGKVPILGELLVGGKDEGVFGAKFAIRGTMSSPDIIVNPLSLLTPGFLRNIFDAFPDSDSDAPDVTPSKKSTYKR